MIFLDLLLRRFYLSHNDYQIQFMSLTRKVKLKNGFTGDIYVVLMLPIIILVTDRDDIKENLSYSLLFLENLIIYN